tara:strand:- start:1599 stop:1838 length:240 start_codon:yes stop_codon:yes gene_type:complete
MENKMKHPPANDLISNVKLAPPEVECIHFDGPLPEQGGTLVRGVFHGSPAIAVFSDNRLHSDEPIIIPVDAIIAVLSAS